MKKNVSGQVIGAQMISATDGSAFTGAVTCYVTGNGGTQAAGSVGSGACTHEGNGFHTYTPAQAETNYDHVAFTFIGTGAVPVTIQVYTDFPQSGDAFTRTLNDLDAAGIRSAVGLASANLDTQLADIPTVAEFNARTLVAADYLVVDDLPANFAALGINASGHISRVTLVDTTTTNTDMRGTDGAYTGTPPTVGEIADGVWDEAQSGHVGAGTFGAYLDSSVSGVSTGGVSAADIADAVWDEILSGHTVVGSAGEALTDAAAGSGGGLDAAGVRAAIGLASANLDTQLADLPTVAEFNARTKVAADYFDPAEDLVQSNLVQIDGQATNGNNAVLKLKRLEIINTTPDETAVHVESTDVAVRVTGVTWLRGIGENDVPQGGTALRIDGGNGTFYSGYAVKLGGTLYVQGTYNNEGPNSSGVVVVSGASGVQIQGDPWISCLNLGATTPELDMNIAGSVESVNNPVTVGTNNDKDGYSLDTAPPTAAENAAAILVTPANKLATNADGSVNASGVDVDEQAIADAVVAELDFDAMREDMDTLLLRISQLRSGVYMHFPVVEATGAVTLFEGFDYTAIGNAAIAITEQSAGQFDPDRLALGTYRFYMRHQTSGADYDGPASLSTDGAGLNTLSADVLSVDLPTVVGVYDWFFYAVTAGTGSDTQGEYGIVYGTLELRRGKKTDC